MLTMSKSTYQIRIDDTEKQETFAVFRDLGVTPAQAIKMFFTQVRVTKSIPFEIKNQEYNQNIKNIILDKNDYSKVFDNVQDLLHDLKN